MNSLRRRYWLIGGVGGVIVALIMLLILYSVAVGVHDIGDAYGPLAESIFGFIGTVLLITPLSNAGFSLGVSVFIMIPYAFLLGALVGLLYGKIKKQKQTSQTSPIP